MDILIKGMKMPKSCEECWMTYEGDSDNCPVVNESVVKYMVEEKRHPNCPLVALPPHGRLIDVEPIEKEVKTWTSAGLDKYDFLYELDHAEVVVEANYG